MQLSLSIFVFVSINIFLLITAVYTNVYIRLHFGVRFSVVDIFLVTAQTANLILLLRYDDRSESFFLKSLENYGLLFIIQVVFILLLLLRFILLFIKISDLRWKLLTPQSIRETVDYLPGGICISDPSGKPILTNYKMNELIYLLTGKTIMNALLTWEELLRFVSANGCEKLDEQWMAQSNLDVAPDECMFFSLPDSRIWRFRQEELIERQPHYIQLEATDISDLYHYSRELYENNLRLAEQYERQKNLLENIVEINHEKEILTTKIRIHDDLGRSIITTKQHLLNQTLTENIPYLTEIWSNTIRNLIDFTSENPEQESSPEAELLKAANMVGCRINFHNQRPTGRKTALLFYALVREALTNAAMHANADQLDVSISQTDFGYHVVISDNGNVQVSSVTEGSGLTNLRRRLEQDGASLQVICEEGVVLIADFPAEKHGEDI